jgi:ComF family protein
MIKKFLSWVLPRICVACGFESYNENLDLCEYCKKNLPWLENRCYQCGARLDKETEALICDKCQSSPPPFNRLCALFQYKPPLIKLINSLKFGQQLYPAAVLGYLLAEELQQKWYINLPLPEIIIPVPLHVQRHRSRGYNQALELCLPLRSKLGIDLRPDLCERVNCTAPQARLKRTSRTKNLQSAFVVSAPVKYKHVALVDDVVTTGSTVSAVAKALLAGGVEIVDVWCICR